MLFLVDILKKERLGIGSDNILQKAVSTVKYDNTTLQQTILHMSVHVVITFLARIALMVISSDFLYF